VAAFLPVLLQNNLSAFWHDSIAYQATRSAPFSIWGLYGGLSIEQHLVQGAGVGLGLLVAFWPRRRDIVGVAALGAAVVIALQLGITYWFYLYIVWFFPLVIVALFGSYPARGSRLAGEPAGAGSLADLAGAKSAGVVVTPQPL
jgi:hypothetical protein